MFALGYREAKQFAESYTAYYAGGRTSISETANQWESLEQRPNYPRSSLLSTGPHETFTEKCWDTVHLWHMAKRHEHRTAGVAGSKVCREKDAKPVTSKHKITSLCKKWGFFPSAPFGLV